MPYFPMFMISKYHNNQHIPARNYHRTSTSIGHDFIQKPPGATVPYTISVPTNAVLSMKKSVNIMTTESAIRDSRMKGLLLISDDWLCSWVTDQHHPITIFVLQGNLSISYNSHLLPNQAQCIVHHT